MSRTERKLRKRNSIERMEGFSFKVKFKKDGSIVRGFAEEFGDDGFAGVFVKVKKCESLFSFNKRWVMRFKPEDTLWVQRCEYYFDVIMYDMI